MTQAETILFGANILDTEYKRIIKGNIRIRRGLVTGIDPPGTSYQTEANIIDVTDQYVSPGFIDSHLHIESSMVSPLAFSKRVLEHGTTSVFVDPHEITNVAGSKGIDFFLDQSARAPIDIFIGIPSCVPATPLEEAGAAITLEDIKKYIDDPRVYGLAEMMNFPGIIAGQGDAREKVDYVYTYGKIVDGHCPGVTDDNLRTYVSNGHDDGVVRILSDHESTSAAEVMEKYQVGMWLMLRYGSASKDLNTILPDLLAADHPLERLMLCSDDVDPQELQEQGHVNRIIKRARNILQQHTGMGLEKATLIAVALATSHPAQYFSRFFRLHEHMPVGQITPGYKANLVVFNSLEDLDIDTVFSNGKLVVEDDKYVGESVNSDYSELLDSVHLERQLTAADFRVSDNSRRQDPEVRIIRAIPGSLVTESFKTSLPLENGELRSDPDRDIAKIAVFERHRGSGAYAVGFVQGLGLRNGAIASTVAHDSHNLIIAGTEEGKMAQAGNHLAELGGGMVVVTDRVNSVPLQIGGLMSTKEIDEVAAEYNQLRQAAKQTGSEVEELFMTLSFLALPVIPELKITSNGLVDVNEFSLVPLIA